MKGQGRVKARVSAIAGAIRPAVDISEIDAFPEPTRLLCLDDSSGRLHGRLEWIDSEFTDEFLEALKDFCQGVMNPATVRGGAA